VSPAWRRRAIRRLFRAFFPVSIAPARRGGIDSEQNYFLVRRNIDMSVW